MIYRFLTKDSPLSDQQVKELNALLRELSGERAKLTTLERARGIIGLPQQRFLVAINEKDEIVGMAMLFVKHKLGESIGDVEDVVRHPAEYGKGLGEGLMQRILEAALEEGLTHLDLTSRPSRVEANKLYIRLGFRLRNPETNLYQLRLNTGDP
jgi:ribosomal protein S18 acetylase RimI-like enzyme